MKQMTKLSRFSGKYPPLITLVVVTSLLGSFNAVAETGITRDKITIGGVMDLEGRSRGLGQGMKNGIMDVGQLCPGRDRHRRASNSGPRRGGRRLCAPARTRPGP